MSRKPASLPPEPAAPSAVAAHPLPQTGGAFILVDGQLVAEADIAPEPAPENTPETDR